MEDVGGEAEQELLEEDVLFAKLFADDTVGKLVAPVHDVGELGHADTVVGYFDVLDVHFDVFLVDL